MTASPEPSAAALPVPVPLARPRWSRAVPTIIVAAFMPYDPVWFRSRPPLTRGLSGATGGGDPP